MEDYDKLINGQLESILSVMDRRNVSAEDRMRIREAFEFAREAHAGQKRKSGAP